MHPLNPNPGITVGQLGEIELIRRITEWLGSVNPPSPEGIGDDCAVYQPEGGRPQLITTDPVIDGYHFDDTVPPGCVGAKLLKRNISDVAAMGGRPHRAVLSLALPATTGLEWLRDFCGGLRECALEYETLVVGGDVAQTSGPLTANLTLIGDAPSGRVLTRRGAAIGDHLLVTGELGGSLKGHHYRFSPRVKEGVWLAGLPEVRAMIDLSDGLAKDLPALLPQDGQAELDWEALPIREEVPREPGDDVADRWVHALCDGEDYELLFTLDETASVPDFLRRWQAALPTRVTLIGSIAHLPEDATEAPPIRIPPGYPQLKSLRAHEHFRTARPHRGYNIRLKQSPPNQAP